MIRSADLPSTLPVFPLPGAILLPRSRLPLHIFEPRYLAMIEDCMKTTERLIAMVQPNPRPSGGAGGLYEVGCAGRVTQFSETEDGRYMVTLTGVSRFRITSEIEGFAAYRRFNVDWSSFGRDPGPAERSAGFDRPVFMALLSRYFDSKHLSVDWETLRPADEELLINSLSMLLDFVPEDKQALLEAPTLNARIETLATLIEIFLRGGANEVIMQ